VQAQLNPQQNSEESFIMATLVDTTLADTTLSKPERAAALLAAVTALPAAHQEELQQALVKVGEPDSTTSNKVWLIVIRAFAVVLVGSVLVLGIGYFMPPATGGTKPETIFAVFTTVAAFLAGLFAPSPVARK
jgi:hypothetical protein